MGGEALQCSYVVLSVGRYLDPALAVRNLDPELPLPYEVRGFFCLRESYSAISAPLSANSIQPASTV